MGTPNHEHSPVYDSKGPIATMMPVFNNDGNEIMHVLTLPDGMLMVSYEDPEELSRLRTEIMYPEDYADLLENQP